ncbi:MAG: ELM1/GtrOC1 family putative glycosyltransferase [Hyphomicrobiaceae bacterium]
MSPTKVLLISDRRPGHTNLSEGIAAAFARRRSTEVNRIEVSRGGWPGPMAALATRSPFTPERILSIIYGLDEQDLPDADVIISAGAETLAANVCSAKLKSAKNIFYGSLRQYRAADFALVMTSYKRSVTAPNMVQFLKPSALDPDKLPDLSGGGPPRVLGLLLGGPTRNTRFSESEWKSLVDLVENSYRTNGIRWHVSDSRRTPHVASDMFRAKASDADGAIVQFISSGSPSSPPLSDLFAKVDGVVCTSDSSSMVSEAVWARRPLVAAEPLKFKISRNEQEYRRWLTQNRWCATAKISRLRPESLITAFESVVPRKANALEELADLLESRLHMST